MALTVTTSVVWSSKITIPCLGHADFFERWCVCFDSRKKLFRVSEHWG